MITSSSTNGTMGDKSSTKKLGSIQNKDNHQISHSGNGSSQLPGSSDLLSSFLPSNNTNGSKNSHVNGSVAKEKLIEENYNPNIKNYPISQRKIARQAAKDEAQNVISSLKDMQDHGDIRRNGHSQHYKQMAKRSSMKNSQSISNEINDRYGQMLDNFNLLGVVTTPRILEQIAAGKANNDVMDYVHNVNGTSNDTSALSTSTEGSISSFIDPSFFSSMSAMSNTLSKEIGSLNSTLYSYSKSYLGTMPYSGNGAVEGFSVNSLSSMSGNLDFEAELNAITANSSSGGVYPYVFGEDMLKGQIPNEELPPEITDLDLSSVEAYLRKCGAVAERLNLSNIESNGSDDEKQDNAKNEQGESNIEQEENESDPTKGVPEIFFSQYFDLTDPETFSSLLVLQDADENELESDDDIIKIQDPTDFTQYLDSIELALLHQVRTKSSSFFRETNRFTHLKSLVASSVHDVQSLRHDLDQIRERSILDAEMVPLMDRRRKDTQMLKKVLDEIENVVEVKTSVGNLIQDGQYLEAVERINLARSLLNGECSDPNEKKTERHVLKKITALNKIHEQLAQYENLVVMDLSSELVETFLSWNSNSDFLSSISTSSTTPTKVKNTIIALKRCGKVSTMADIYREKLCDTIRVTIKTTVTECALDASKNKEVGGSATIVSLPNKGTNTKGTKKSSIIEGVTSMSFNQFMDCLEMIYENVLGLLKSAAGVNKFCIEEGISFKDDEDREDGNKTESGQSSNNPSALSAGADLSHRSVSELLRLRKETHSLISFEEMKKLWDSCLAFTLQLERISGQKAYVLRSTLLAQAKAFVERKHESNMSSLAAALDTERWTQCDVSSERQISLDRLCSGRAVVSLRDSQALSTGQSEKQPTALVEGKRYRVVWSCLLLIEMILSNVACAAHFQTLATNVVGKVSELLRLFNSRATQLVLGAGAIHSSARLKSINAKHLALVTQCVGVVQSILPHIRAALMSQLPQKQQTLLSDLDKIKKEYAEHHDKVLEKFVSIIGGIVEHSLMSRVALTNFDERAKFEDKSDIQCCPFLEGIVANTSKMHQVLFLLLPTEDLMDVFSRIFAHLDSKVPKIFLSVEAEESSGFSFPESVEGKQRMILEVEQMTRTLNSLKDVRPWDFGAMKFLSRRLGITIESHDDSNDSNKEHDESLDQGNACTDSDSQTMNVLVESNPSPVPQDTVDTDDNIQSESVQENEDLSSKENVECNDERKSSTVSISEDGQVPTKLVDEDSTPVDESEAEHDDHEDFIKTESDEDIANTNRETLDNQDAENAIVK